MTINPYDIVVIIICVASCAFFSGIEIAFVSTSRLKIELKSAQGDKAGLLLSKFVKNTPRVITTALVGNNLALVMFGISSGNVLTAIFVNSGFLEPHQEHSFTSVVLQTVISTLLILFFGEFVPKAIFQSKAETIMFGFLGTRMLRFFYWLFGPFSIFVNAGSHFFLRKILRLKYEEEGVTFSKEDLNYYLQETLPSLTDTDDQPEIDAEMFTNAMAFNEIRVREFMVPRTELVALSINGSVEELMDLFVETGYSRIIIYKDSLDTLLGFVHHSAVFKRPETIAEALQPILMVPESMAATTLLKEFSKYRKTMAVVVDEFGGTEGIVTVEDLVEEVFGDIQDEHDESEEEDLLAKKIDEHTWLFNARLEIDDLNETWGLDLPYGEYNTLGGLIIHHEESIPAVNDTVQIGHFRFVITDASENKVNIVRVERLESEEE
jgi:putative hemolysin